MIGNWVTKTTADWWFFINVKTDLSLFSMLIRKLSKTYPFEPILQYTKVTCENNVTRVYFYSYFTNYPAFLTWYGQLQNLTWMNHLTNPSRARSLFGGLLRANSAGIIIQSCMICSLLRYLGLVWKLM